MKRKHTSFYSEDAIKRSIKLKYIKEIKEKCMQALNAAEDWYYTEEWCNTNYRAICARLNEIIKLLDHE